MLPATKKSNRHESRQSTTAKSLPTRLIPRWLKPLKLFMKADWGRPTTVSPHYMLWMTSVKPDWEMRVRVLRVFETVWKTFVRSSVFCCARSAKKSRTDHRCSPRIHPPCLLNRIRSRIPPLRWPLLQRVRSARSRRTRWTRCNELFWLLIICDEKIRQVQYPI